MPKNTRSIEVDADTFAQITHLAKALSMPKKTFLSLLLCSVFDVGSQFDKGLVILYTGDFTGAWLKLNFVGRSNIQFGSKEIEHGEDKSPITRIIRIKEKGESKHEQES